MSRNLVSVVIPTGSRSAALAKALDSVNAQTHANGEVIVVVDRSTMIPGRWFPNCRTGIRGFGISTKRTPAYPPSEIAASHWLTTICSCLWIRMTSGEPWTVALQVSCQQVNPALGMI